MRHALRHAFTRSVAASRVASLRKPVESASFSVTQPTDAKCEPRVMLRSTEEVKRRSVAFAFNDASRTIGDEVRQLDSSLRVYRWKRRGLSQFMLIPHQHDEVQGQEDLSC